MTNPLLSAFELPPFTAIRAEHVEAAIRQVLSEARAELSRLLQVESPTWENLVAPFESIQHRLARTWSPVSHLNGVANSDELRAAYNACLPLLTSWHAEVGQNEKLYAAYEWILTREGSALSAAQRKLLENALRDFRLAGVALPAERKTRFKAVMEQLASLQAKFDENVLDATNAWTRHIENDVELAGLPMPILTRAKAAADSRQLPGWFFTLDAPNYQAVMTHAESIELRRAFYEAWVTRASDQGPGAGQWDNTQVMEQILALRCELAQLVGFENYAEYSLATKMAKSTGEVGEFLEQLANVAKPAAKRELVELERLAGRSLDAWDAGFYGERLRRERFQLSEEALRPYFPAPVVLNGLFAVAEKLYEVKVSARPDVETYHEDVRFFDVLNPDGSRRGGFYIDLYARPKKRGGAWMDECVGRMRTADQERLPIAYLVCNFMPPAAEKPSLLTHSEVVTLFHEFGHGLQHFLTRVDYPSVAGINGVPWDAVELPSQFMENYAWTAEVLPLISAHIETGEPLPAQDLERLRASRSFHSGLQTVRQLEFGLFDLRIHSEFRPDAPSRIAATLQEVRERVAAISAPAFNRFAHSFSHIFAGGYAAGYYSYKWAEVLAADAWAAFLDSGVFSRETARRFAEAILETGGGCDAMQAFVKFRGREPQIEPLLKQLGLAA